MSQRKVKRIRQLAKQQGLLNGSDYKLLDTKKMMYSLDKDGKPTATPVTRTTLINVGKTEYRKLLKAYKNGEFNI